MSRLKINQCSDNKMMIIILTVVMLSPILALKELINDNNNFAASVYKEMTMSEDNFLVSPLSAFLILSLSNAGARNETAKELRNVLNLPYCRHTIDAGIKTLLRDLSQNPSYVLQVINKIYIKEGYEIREEFRTIAQELYDTKVENLNFTCKYQAAEAINGWVQEKTNDKIQNLIDPEIIGNRTSAVLVNALRFKANWTIPFQHFATLRRDFVSFDSIVNLDFMHLYEEEFEFYEKPHLNATFLELPFDGDNATMTIVLPRDVDGLPLLESHIDDVLQPPAATHRDIFNVALPKFKLETKINFKGILQNLGVKRAFEESGADFTGIAGFKGELFIDDVVQKSFLEVDIDGIEAVAATYIVKIVNRNGGTSKDFVADHPFIFYVKVQDVIVFLGRVVLP